MALTLKKRYYYSLMTQDSSSKKKSKLTKLEIANNLYEFAFQVKKQRFKEKHPELSPAEIDAVTKHYFLTLKERMK